RVEFALETGAHGAACAVEQGARVGDAALAQLEEFAHAGGEDALHRAALAGAVGGQRIEVGEVAAGPEDALELVVEAAYSLQAEELAEDDGPACQRHGQ